MFQKKNKGFTLIELLVVVAIIGLLSSLVLASLNTARTKARDARRISDLKQIQTALELYFDTNRSYPTALSVANLVNPAGYISVLPTDPSSSGACTTGSEAPCYKYAALGSGSSCTSFHLGASLEQIGGSALSGDADASAATVCTGGGTDFSGADTGKCNTTDTGSYCYDIKP